MVIFLPPSPKNWDCGVCFHTQHHHFSVLSFWASLTCPSLMVSRNKMKFVIQFIWLCAAFPAISLSADCHGCGFVCLRSLSLRLFLQWDMGQCSDQLPKNLRKPFYSAQPPLSCGVWSQGHEWKEPEEAMSRDQCWAARGRPWLRTQFSITHVAVPPRHVVYFIRFYQKYKCQQNFASQDIKCRNRSVFHPREDSPQLTY